MTERALPPDSTTPLFTCRTSSLALRRPYYYYATTPPAGSYRVRLSASAVGDLPELVRAVLELFPRVGGGVTVVTRERR